MMRSTPRVGFYGGTFDPVTTGHLDIIERASRLVDKLIIGVAENPDKSPLLPLATRVDCARHAVEDIQKKTETRIEVIGFHSLLVEAARQQGAHLVFRGLRVISDFDHEIQMYGVNRRLDSSIETVFLMASEQKQFISSSMVREIARYGGDVSPFVTKYTQDCLMNALS